MQIITPNPTQAQATQQETQSRRNYLPSTPSNSPCPSSPKPFAALCRREETKRVVTTVEVSPNHAKHKPDPLMPHHQKEMRIRRRSAKNTGKEEEEEENQARRASPSAHRGEYLRF
jgi:hypothetical protein